jgi:hypothetical protein
MVSKKVKKKEDSQLAWILFIIGLVFAGFLVTYFVIVPALSTFNYAGVKWEKIDQGNLELYHSRFSPHENFVYNAYFRTDPRKNNISLGETSFGFFSNAIISLDVDSEDCGGANVIGNKMLGEFLTSLNIQVSGALNDEETAEELNLSFADCSSSAIGRNVFLVKKSEEPSIERDSVHDSCYLINVGNCENIKTVERFISGVLLQIEEEAK